MIISQEEYNHMKKLLDRCVWHLDNMLKVLEDWREERKMKEELRSKKEEMLAKKSEARMQKVDEEKDNEKPSDKQEEEAEEPTTEQDLKLSPFSQEEKFEQVFGNKQRQQKKTEALQVVAAANTALNSPREVLLLNVVAKEVGIRKTRSWTGKEARGKRSECNEQSKTWAAVADGDGKEEKHSWVVNRVKQIKWGRRPKIGKKVEKEKGFRANLIQHPTVGPKSFLAQTCHPIVIHVSQSSKGVVPTIGTSEASTKTVEQRNGGFFLFDPKRRRVSYAAFVSENQEQIGATASETKTNGKLDEFSYFFNVDTARSSCGSHGGIGRVADYKWRCEANVWPPSFDDLEALKRAQVKESIHILLVRFIQVEVVTWFSKQILFALAKAWEDEVYFLGNRLCVEDIEVGVSLGSVSGAANKELQGKFIRRKPDEPSYTNSSAFSVIEVEDTAKELMKNGVIIKAVELEENILV